MGVIFINIFNLFGKLTLDNSDYKNKIEESKKSNNELAENTKQMGSKKLAIWAAVLAAVTAVLNKVKDLIVETANYADQIGDLAQKWGFTTKEIQEFDYWATMSGTTLESLLTGMRGLVNQAEAGAGAFTKLGVSVKNTDGTLKDQKTLFLETIDALQKVENQTERNALQFEIFGRAGIELGQIIDRNAEELQALSQEAENLGIILSEDTINQASEFNDKLDQMRLSFKSVMAEIIAGSPDAEEKFTVFLENLIDRFNEWAPKLLSVTINLLGKILAGAGKIIFNLPAMIVDTLFSIDWLQLGLDIGKALLDGIIKTLGWVIGYGWLWGRDEPSTPTVQNSNVETAISTVSSTGRVERTETVNETLDVTVRVESDGTEAGEKNLDVISDMLIEKINKALGDEV